MKRVFERIYSIELDEKLHVNAKERFRSAKHVELIHGNSAKALGGVIAKINQPALFWLDGHYSGGETARGDNDTPIYEELAHILGTREQRHVILIDDARCFGSEAGYPSLEQLKAFIQSRDCNLQMSVQDDCIRLEPKTGGVVAP